MAATRFISMHTGKDKTPAVSLSERIEYILNPAKTDGGKWVSCHGCELTQRMTKGRYQFVVATHVDKGHIHNHIIFAAISENSARRFRDFLGSAKVVRKISARLCLENGLSVIFIYGFLLQFKSFFVFGNNSPK